MAFIDYGALVFKNGKLITTDLFEKMESSVGWSDRSEKYRYHDYNGGAADGNYFAFVGDEDLTVAFYKDFLSILTTDKFAEDEEGKIPIYRETVWLGQSGYHWWKWTYEFCESPMTVTKRNGYYVFRWKCNDDSYKVYFGLGVDLDHYKKYRIVNYYRSLPYLIRHTLRDMKYNIEIWLRGY